MSDVSLPWPPDRPPSACLLFARQGPELTISYLVWIEHSARMVWSAPQQDSAPIRKMANKTFIKHNRHALRVKESLGWRRGRIEMQSSAYSTAQERLKSLANSRKGGCCFSEELHWWTWSVANIWFCTAAMMCWSKKCTFFSQTGDNLSEFLELSFPFPLLGVSPPLVSTRTPILTKDFPKLPGSCLFRVSFSFSKYCLIIFEVVVATKGVSVAVERKKYSRIILLRSRRKKSFIFWLFFINMVERNMLQHFFFSKLFFFSLFILCFCSGHGVLLDHWMIGCNVMFSSGFLVSKLRIGHTNTWRACRKEQNDDLWSPLWIRSKV